MYQLRCVVGEAIFRPLVIPLSSSNKEFVLGRGKAADILIKCFDEELHCRLSRRHLKISVRDSKHVYIEDLGGTNGSKINGKSLKPNCRNVVRKEEDVDRSFGCPTIRKDIPYKEYKSMADY